MLLNTALAVVRAGFLVAAPDAGQPTAQVVLIPIDAL